MVIMKLLLLSLFLTVAVDEAVVIVTLDAVAKEHIYKVVLSKGGFFKNSCAVSGPS